MAINFHVSMMISWLALLVVVFYSLEVLGGDLFSLPAHEFDDLRELYISTKGDEWIWKEPYTEYGQPWDFYNASNPCSGWQGITCSTPCALAPCNVVQIQLNGFNLQGTIPSNVGNFSFLQDLDLSLNSITGAMPMSLGNLSLLRSLYLYNNKIASTIPASLGQLSHLYSFLAYHNKLHGAIPDSMGSLISLRSLDLSNNHLTGSLPDSLCALVHMQSLSMKDNKLTGKIPVELGLMSSLYYVDFSKNQLTGPIPESLGNITRTLVYISLDSNYLSQSLPASLGNLTLLKRLIVNDNRLTGTLPETYRNLRNTEIIEMNYNHINGTFPAYFGNFPGMSRLFLQQNLLEGPLPAALCNASALQDLLLGGNMLSGTLPSEWGALKSISDISFTGNMLSGTIPDSYGNMSTLTSIIFTKNPLNGSLPESIGGWINMESITITATYLGGTLPTTMCHMTKLSEIQILQNRFHGPLPECIGQLQALTSIMLGENSFSGTFPPALYTLPQLQFLQVGLNRFNGTLSDALGQLSQLEQLYVLSNRFTGTIPESLGNLSSLRSLILARNEFTGTIPSTFFNLSSLQLVAFSENHLYGNISRSLSRMTNITAALFDHNHFTGSFSDFDFSGFHYLTALDLASNRFHGSLPQSLLDVETLEYLFTQQNMFTGSLVFNKRNHSAPAYVYHDATDASADADLLSLDAAAGFDDADDDNGNYHDDDYVPPAMINTTFALRALLINANFYTGPILFTSNSALLTSKYLKYLNLSANLFSNQVNSNIYNHWHSAVSIDLSANFFSGPVDTVFSNMTLINALTLSLNCFTGHTYPLLSSKSKYIAIHLDQNAFTGTLSSAFFARNDVQFFVASLNCLSGSLPTAYTVDQRMNNTNGELTSEENGGFCQSPHLTELLLDGLHASPLCGEMERLPLPAFLLQGKTQAVLAGDHEVSGPLPSCLFTSLPSLTTVHVSGNRLSGDNSLSQLTQIPKSLTDLDLSHNALAGTVSEVLWQHNFTSLDLSFNQLQGTVSSLINPIYSDPFVATTLRLQVNRFSGDVPPALHAATNIEMLSGNLFSCKSGGLWQDASRRSMSLPMNDPDAPFYACGSDNTNSALLLALCILLAAGGVIVGAVYWHMQHQHQLSLLLVAESIALTELDNSTASQDCRKNRAEDTTTLPLPVVLQRTYKHLLVWWDVFTPTEASWHIALNNSVPNLYSQEVCDMHCMQRHWQHLHTLLYVDIRIFVLLLVLVGMPLYALLTEYWGTYMIQYVWTVSAAYLGGENAAIVLLVFWWLLVAYLLVVVVRLMMSMEEEATEEGNNKYNSRDGGNQRQITVVHNLGGHSSGVSNQLPNSAATTAATATAPTTSLSSYFDKICSAHFLFNFTITLMNIAIILAVNAAFVFSIGRNNLSHDALLLISLAVSAFKLFWSNVVLADWCVKKAPVYFSQMCLFVVLIYRGIFRSSTAESDTSNPIYIYPVHLSPTVHIVLSLFNNVVAPYLAEAFVSPNCFHYAFWSAPPVASTSQGSTCYLAAYVQINVNENGIRGSALRGQVTCAPLDLLPSNLTVLGSVSRVTNLSFLPPFAYNHSCSSSLVTAFIYVFIWRFVLSGVVLPCAALVLKWVQGMLVEMMYARSFVEATSTSEASLNMGSNNTNNASTTSATNAAAEDSDGIKADHGGDPQPSAQPMVLTDEARRLEVVRLRWWFRRVTQLLPSPLRLLDCNGAHSYNGDTLNLDAINNNNINKHINNDHDHNTSHTNVRENVQNESDTEEVKRDSNDQQLASTQPFRPIDINSSNRIDAPSQPQQQQVQPPPQQPRQQRQQYKQQHKQDYIRSLNHTDILPALLYYRAIVSGNARGVTIVADLAVLLTFGVLFPPLAVIVFVAIVLEQAFHRLVWGRYAVLLRQFSDWDGGSRAEINRQHSRLRSQSLQAYMSYRTASDGWNISTTVSSPLTSIDADAPSTNEHAAITAMNTALNATTSLGALDDDEGAQNVVQRHSNRVNYNNYNHFTNNTPSNNLPHHTYATYYATLLHQHAHSFDSLARLLTRGTGLAVIFSAALWSLTLYDTLAGGTSSNGSSSSGGGYDDGNDGVLNRNDSRGSSASSDSWWIVLAMALAPLVLFQPVRLCVLLWMRRQRRKQMEAMEESARMHEDTDMNSRGPRRQMVEDPEAALPTAKIIAASSAARTTTSATTGTPTATDPPSTLGGEVPASYTASPIILIHQQAGDRGSGMATSPARNSSSSSGSSYPTSSYGASTSASSSFLRTFSAHAASATNSSRPSEIELRSSDHHP